MTRDRAIARLLALLAHAAADTNEGRIAGREVERLRARFHITDDEVGAARGNAEAESARLASLPWSDPWLLVLASMVAETQDCRHGLSESGHIRIEGDGAGRAGLVAEVIRRRVEARLERLGPAAIRGLRAGTRHAYTTASTSGATTGGGYTFAYSVPVLAPVSLAEAAGTDDPLDVYRLVLAHRILNPELQAAARRAKEAERARQRAAADYRKEAPRPPAEPTPSADAEAGHEPTPESLPPWAEEQESTARAQAVFAAASRLAARMMQVAKSSPPWAEEEPAPPGTLAYLPRIASAPAMLGGEA